VDRCALFVDAGYVLADGALAVHGTRNRESVSWDYAGVLQFLGSVARDRTGLPLLRCYWYEATNGARRTAEHDTLADLPGVKLRLGPTRPGRREGVEGEIRRDLTVLTRNGAITDALVVSAEEDLAQVIADVQDLGIRVTIVHIMVGRNWTISRSLRQECDDIVEIGEAHLRPYVELVVGAEPVADDARQEIGAYPGISPANGHGPVGAIGNQQALPVGTSANAPPIFTAPVVAEYQRSVQPPATNGRPGPEPMANPPGTPLVGTMSARQDPVENEPLPPSGISASPDAGEYPHMGAGTTGRQPGAREAHDQAPPGRPAVLGQPHAQGPISLGQPLPLGMPPQQAQQSPVMGRQQDPASPAPAQAAPTQASPGAASGGQEQGGARAGQSGQHENGLGQPGQASQRGQLGEPGQYRQDGVAASAASAGLPGRLPASPGQPGLAPTPEPPQELSGMPDTQDVQLSSQRPVAPVPGEAQLAQGRPGRMDEGQPGQMDRGQPGRMDRGQPGQMEQGQPGRTGQGQPGQMEQGRPGQMEQGRPGQMEQGRPGQTDRGQPARMGQGQPGQMDPGQPAQMEQGRPGQMDRGEPGWMGQGEPGQMDRSQPAPMERGQPGLIDQGLLGRITSPDDPSLPDEAGQRGQVPMAGPVGMPGRGEFAGALGQGRSPHMSHQAPQSDGGPGQNTAPTPHGVPSPAGMHATQAVYQAAPPVSAQLPGPGREEPHGQAPQAQMPGEARQTHRGPVPTGVSPPVSEGPPVASGRQFQDMSHQYDPPGAYPSGSPDRMSAAQQFAGVPPGQVETGMPGAGYVPQQGLHVGPQVGRLHAPGQPPVISLADGVQAAHGEGFSFGQTVARDAPALWLEAVLARKPRMPSDLEARLLQDSALPIDSLLHDEVRHALRRGFWDALERSRH
jgi:NYN domain